ncbi:hypothetical protein KAH55_13735, partial [bacterium]|nr:hypothetical protein [bacterium]
MTTFMHIILFVVAILGFIWAVIVGIPQLVEYRRKKNDRKNKLLKLINPQVVPEKLFGREKVLKELHAKLRQKKQLLLVYGLGGIGKTTVAQAYVTTEKFTKVYDHIAWVRVLGNIRQDLLQALRLPLNLNFPETASIDEKFNFLITQLRNMTGHNLLVLDNANDSAELIANMASLKATGWTVLITSRCRLAGKYPVLQLDVLPKPEAAKLFLHHYQQQNSEPDLLKKLLRQINYHTLLIELLAKAGREKKLSVAAILTRMEQAEGIKDPDLQRIIDIGEHADHTNHSHQDQLYRYILSIFEPEKLAAASIRLLRYFAV